MNPTAEDILNKYFPSGIIGDEYSIRLFVLKAMKELAKKAALEAWDAAIEYEQVAQFGPVPNPMPDKQTYIKKYD